jgi:hypothetical protein
MRRGLVIQRLRTKWPSDFVVILIDLTEPSDPCSRSGSKESTALSPASVLIIFSVRAFFEGPKGGEPNTSNGEG